MGAGEGRGEGEEIDLIQLTVDELSLVNSLAVVPYHVVILSAPTHQGFTEEHIRSFFDDPEQKYCVAIHFDEEIYLFHSVYIVVDEIFGCTARSGISDTYLWLVASEFTRPVDGLTNFSVFLAEGRHLICRISADPRSATRRGHANGSPLPCYFVYWKSVSRFSYKGIRNQQRIQILLAPLDPLNYIHLAAEDKDARYNPLIYFLIAAYQNLNPMMPDLYERECIVTKYPKNKLFQDKYFTMK